MRIQEKIHCLLIEDNPIDKKLIETMLSSEINLISVDTLSEALKRISQKNINIIISNLGLPDSYGMETFTKIYSVAPNIPIIILTALDNKKLAIDAVKGGAQDYIIKGEINTLNINRSLKYAIERKLVEAQLREAETRYRTVADFTYAWEYWVGPDGGLKYVSPACLSMTGYPLEKFINDSSFIEKIILPEDKEIWKNHRKNVAVPNGKEIEFRIRRNDGTICWIAHICKKVTTEDNQFLGYRASNRDITTQKKDEEQNEKLQFQLREAQKMETLGTIVGGIAHKFNNLLTSILGYSEMCILKIPKEQESHFDIKKIALAANHAKILVDQMLIFCNQSTQEKKNN